MSNKNLTSKQFADELNISPSIVTHLTSGRNNPSLDIVLKIKNKFPEVDLDWLLMGVSDTPIYKEIKAASPILSNEEEIKVVERNPILEKQAETIPSEKQESLNFEEKEFEIQQNDKNELIKVILFYKNGKFEVFKP